MHFFFFPLLLHRSNIEQDLKVTVWYFFLRQKMNSAWLPDSSCSHLSLSACPGTKTISRNPNLVLLSLQGATLSSLNPFTPKLDAHQCKFLQAFLLKAPLGKLPKLLKLALGYRPNSVNLNSVTLILCK